MVRYKFELRNLFLFKEWGGSIYFEVHNSAPPGVAWNLFNWFGKAFDFTQYFLSVKAKLIRKQRTHEGFTDA